MLRLSIRFEKSKITEPAMDDESEKYDDKDFAGHIGSMA